MCQPFVVISTEMKSVNSRSCPITIYRGVVRRQLVNSHTPRLQSPTEGLCKVKASNEAVSHHWGLSPATEVYTEIKPHNTET
jgi:hypothetical protein